MTKKIINLFIVLLILIIFIYGGILLYFDLSNQNNSFVAKRIAHAGGSIYNSTYTNSFEALNENISNGFEYFELDFSFTRDYELVNIHDWSHSFKRSFGFEMEKKPNLNEFIDLRNNHSKYTKATLKELIFWLQNNPKAKIITDIKDKNILGLEIMAKEVPNHGYRIIPQIYHPENYKTIKDLGYKNIIWTLYRYKGDENEVLDWVNKFDESVAITMPKEKANTDLPQQISEFGNSTYVHTINSLNEKNNFINNQGISEIYTDYLLPGI